MAADRRVVVTGAAAISPLGHDWPTIEAHLRSCRNAVRVMPEWDVYAGLNTKLAAPAQDFELPPNYNRKTTRSMGKVAIMSVRATEVALREAGLHEHPVLRSGRTGGPTARPRAATRPPVNSGACSTSSPPMASVPPPT